MEISIADWHLDCARQLEGCLQEAGLRVEVDARAERMNAKTRDARLQKMPYMLVVGDQEMAGGQAAVRLRSGENLGPRPLEEFLALAKEAERERR